MKKGKPITRAVSTTDDPTPPTAPTREEQKSAPLGDVAANPVNPRQSIDQDAFIGLVASIREFGQLQPVLVVTRRAFLAIMDEHVETIGSASYVVVGGSQRLSALGEVGADTVAIEVDDAVAATRQRFILASLTENVQRVDLTPLDEARTVQRMVGEVGSKSDVARQLGKKPGWVTQRLALLNLSDDMVAELEAGRLTITAARRLGSKVDPEQQYTTWQEEQDFLRRKNQPSADTRADGGTEETAATDGDDFLRRKNQPAPEPTDPGPATTVDTAVESVVEPTTEVYSSAIDQRETDRSSSGPSRPQPYRPKKPADTAGDQSRSSAVDSLVDTLGQLPAGDDTVSTVATAVRRTLSEDDVTALAKRLTEESSDQ